MPDDVKTPLSTLFLSCASPDEAAVAGLYDTLQAAGFLPWMASKDLLPGESIRTATERALRQADFVLVCLSPDSVDRRGALQREIRQALDMREEMLPGDIYVIPVRLRPCGLPESLREMQPVDLFEPNGVDRLLHALRAGSQRRAQAPAPAATPNAQPQPAGLPFTPQLVNAWQNGRLAVIWGATPFDLASERENPVLAANRWDRLAAALPAIDVDLTLLPICPILSLDPTGRVLDLFRIRETRVSVVDAAQRLLKPGEHGLYILAGDLKTRNWLALTRSEVRETPMDDDKRRWVLDPWMLVAKSGVTLLLGADPSHPSFRAWWEDVLGPRLGGQIVVAVGDPVAAWPAGVQVVASSYSQLLAALPAPQPVAPQEDGQHPPVAWDETLTALRNVLAALYPTDDRARWVAAEAGLPTGMVVFAGAAIGTWHNLLQEAYHQELVPALLATAQKAFPRNAALAEAAAAYFKQHPA